MYSDSKARQHLKVHNHAFWSMSTNLYFHFIISLVWHQYLHAQHKHMTQVHTNTSIVTGVWVMHWYPIRTQNSRDLWWQKLTKCKLYCTYNINSMWFEVLTGQVPVSNIKMTLYVQHDLRSTLVSLIVPNISAFERPVTCK